MATRQAAALFDETSFQDRDQSGLAPWPSWSASATTAWTGLGRITYTQMLNQRGGIECDFTVTRLAEDRFWIVTGTAFGNHDLGYPPPRADDGSVEVR